MYYDVLVCQCSNQYATSYTFPYNKKIHERHHALTNFEMFDLFSNMGHIIMIMILKDSIIWWQRWETNSPYIHRSHIPLLDHHNIPVGVPIAMTLTVTWATPGEGGRGPESTIFIS